MSVLSDSMEDFELIMPNNVVYGRIKGYVTKEITPLNNRYEFWTLDNRVNEFDIVRCLKDNKCYRLVRRNMDGKLNIFVIHEYTLFTDTE